MSRNRLVWDGRHITEARFDQMCADMHAEIATVLATAPPEGNWNYGPDGCLMCGCTILPEWDGCECCYPPDEADG